MSMGKSTFEASLLLRVRRHGSRSNGRSAWSRNKGLAGGTREAMRT